MYDFIDGNVVEKSPAQIVLKAGDIGFRITVPLSTSEALQGSGARIYTVVLVRDEKIEIFGFLTRLEREVFQLLDSVSGIGPQLAMKVLSGMSAADIISAIAEGCAARLTGIRGIGKKTSERIVLELRDTASEILTGLGEIPASAEDKAVADAMVALVKLGLGNSEARKAVEAARKALAGNVTCEALIRKALG